jgi:prepilin-type N-terminal cleavage/methylation domain-containing protein
MKSERQAAGGRAEAFTLMELMVVVAIIGLVAAMSVPSILQMRREAPMRKAVNDVFEMCERARAGAVLKNTTTTITFHPRTGSVELENGDANAALSTRLGKAPVTSTQFDPSVKVEGLGINLKDWTEADSAPVQFFDNGTCDEMTLVLECDGERQMITLELATSLPTVKSLQ